jgi:threonyl-tRNA synthetase
LAVYIQRIEEAEKRDHRKIGKRLDLFHTQEEAPGMVFWHPNGWTIYQVLLSSTCAACSARTATKTKIPQIVDRAGELGHWGNYDNMFTTSLKGREYAIKPMNCSRHVQAFNQGLKATASHCCVWRNRPSP